MIDNKHLRSFLRRIKRMILKRIVVFRLLFYGTLILTVGTFL
jgi:cytochrome c-type biogenesis protein CcmE